MPRKRVPDDEVSTASDTAKVLGANLRALMGSQPELSSNPKLAEKTKLGTGTISRLKNGQVDATVSTLEALAKAFDMAPWQLLVPNLDPSNRPTLQPVSEQERRLYERLREVAKEINEGR